MLCCLQESLTRLVYAIFLLGLDYLEVRVWTPSYIPYLPLPHIEFVIRYVSGLGITPVPPQVRTLALNFDKLRQGFADAL